MQVLVDTDIFCKLSVGGVFEESLSLLGASIADCRRLPALTQMLRKGRLRTRFGESVCDSLLADACAMPVVHAASDKWLDQMASVNDIDPGEAQLFARAAESGCYVMSGDKRALRAISAVNGLAGDLPGQIVSLESLLIGLCDRFGSDVIGGKIRPLVKHDTAIEICFSPGNDDPVRALCSYYRSLCSEVAPLSLWDPRAGEAI